MKRRPRRDAGLSLLEMLVAMSLLALIGTLAAGSIGFGSAVWERAKAGSDEILTRHAVQKFLRKQIAMARPYKTFAGTATPPVVFTGTPTTLTFLSPIAAEIAPSGLHRIAIAVRPVEGVLDMAFAAVSDTLPDAGESDGQEILLTGYSTIRFWYFGAVDGEDEPMWHDRWEQQTTLPQMVAVATSDPSGPADNVTAWTPLIVALDLARPT